MHCGYLSLRHNWKTNCWNLSLMNTGTSTTRTRSTRKFFLPLLLPLPPPLPPPSEGIGVRHERDCSLSRGPRARPAYFMTSASSLSILVTTASSCLLSSSCSLASSSSSCERASRDCWRRNWTVASSCNMSDTSTTASEGAPAAT